MGSYENDNLVLTAQYLSATDNPFVAVDIERKGFSFFGEGRQGPTGWSVIGGSISSIQMGPTTATISAGSSSAARTGARSRARLGVELARTDPSDGQLAAARTQTARPDAHRVLNQVGASEDAPLRIGNL